MGWDTMFGPETEPSFIQIADYIETPLWVELNCHLQNVYQAKPELSYSKCSMQKGWNVKYRKGGRALCTLYPMSGFFLALVVIGEKERAAAELLMPSMSRYTRELFQRTAAFMGGKWLMLEVTSPDRLDDVSRLIALRMPQNRPCRQDEKLPEHCFSQGGKLL